MEKFVLLPVLLLGVICCAPLTEGAGPSPQDRDVCKSGATASPLRVDTTQRLKDLRAAMINSAYVGTDLLKGYIVPSEDAHQSEYTSDFDARREYICGLSGSAGTAAITTTQAAAWTDGRYFLQADDELDCNWILMKQGLTGVPSITDWFGSVLSSGDKVGIDPTLVGISRFQSYEEKLQKYGIILVPLEKNLIDVIWTTGRPAKQKTTMLVLKMEFAGKTWQDKVKDVRKKMTEKSTDAVIVTALDDVAWLFNMRGSDVPYNPVFNSYAVITSDKIHLFIENPSYKLVQNVVTHLGTKADGSCDVGVATDCVQVHEYTTTLETLKSFNSDSSLNKIWISPSSSYAIYNAINSTKRVMDYTPIDSMKTVKNPIERDGMRRAHLKDAVALIDFVQMLEKSVQNGDYWTELSAEATLEGYRRAQKDNMGLSFHAISAFGSNGAVIHYESSNATNKQITTGGVYLLDSGGQYLDGTTDVTRTFHFGTPNDFEKEAYTRVLMGAIELASAVWSAGVFGRGISALARSALWRVGLDYRHGTGHGIGMFLNVHEGPASLSTAYRKHDKTLEEGMFFSDEPGYYEAGKFGVRLETIVMVAKAETPYNFGGRGYLMFEPISLVPFEKNLINLDLMTVQQKGWLNNFHKRCLEVTGAELKRQGKTDAYKWLQSRTKPIPEYVSSSNCINASVLLSLLSFVYARLL
ncbi:xaa-Pro aminopeptidase 1-like [Lineus longissimus]|uniref:xaa-Pro aminopeptidase 1-like n=1 Tax=Lineus longissimus TaxID=88925 RepID=UPI002B4E4A7C